MVGNLDLADEVAGAKARPQAPAQVSPAPAPDPPARRPHLPRLQQCYHDAYSSDAGEAQAQVFRRP